MVEDTGVGIPLAQQEKIFQAFEQVSHNHCKTSVQHQSKFGGTGLGLAITRKLVQMMQGELKLDSETGRGSRFTVVFHHLRLIQNIPDQADPLKFNRTDANLFASVNNNSRTTCNKLPADKFSYVLQHYLDTEFLPRCLNLDDSTSINEIEDFADALHNLSKQHNNEVLQQWVVQLKWHITQFDINALWHMLEDFPHWIKQHKQ
jgi:hypothetical protein